MRVLYKGKIWDKDAISDLLDRNSDAVAKALMTIYDNQTADERANFATRHHNGIGFTANDAEWLTDIAKKWLVWRRWASERQLAAVRKAIKKYHRQLLQKILDDHEDARLVTGRLPKPESVAAQPVTQPVAWGIY